MYTDIKSYQIIIALLKKYNIKHCVLSAGSRNVPFVHSVEQDDYFKCYSVVDERSAGYFALGLAQELNEPVVISCTSSTAACNYYPAIAEAFYQNVPLIVLTSDRNPAMLGQREDQMINQVGMYDRHVKKSVNLPVTIDDKEDFIYCQRLVNEALLELTHHVNGPVHINIPMKYYSMDFSTKTLPKVNKIDRLDSFSNKKTWKEKIDKLEKAERILILPGQNYYVSNNLKKSLESFFKKFNSSIMVEYMANINEKEANNLFLCMDSRYISKKKFEELLPDIVISFGGNIMGGIKDNLRLYPFKYEHWLVNPDGKVVDLFKSLTTIFECPPEYFFNYFVENSDNNLKNNLIYNNMLLNYKNNIYYPNFDWSNIYVIKNVVEKIPGNSILHLSINNSIRLTNYFNIDPTIKVYANIGTFGIDGSMSSFIGQSVANYDKISYLIIGDLSFFYDMNALRIKHIGNNVRILLVNNQGGGEFYYNKSWINEKSDLHTTARHNQSAEGWAKSMGFKYLKANNKKDFDKVLDEFMSTNSNQPILFEVFTEMKNDSKVVYDFYDLSRPKNATEELEKSSKQILKKVLSGDKITKLKKIIKR